MKKIAFMFALALVGVVYGAANDTVVSFSTPGIDRYADGSRVRTGESYALIWTKNGATFGGLTGDCLPVSENDKIVMVAPLAKRGRCPVTVVEIDAKDAEQYKGGMFALYLLDTRVKGADGKVTLAAYKDGLPQIVNSFGVSDAGEKSFAKVDGVDGSMSGVTPIALADVGVYTDIEVPLITAVELVDAKIRIEVKGMDPKASYFVVPGKTPGNFAEALDAKPDATGFTIDKPEDGEPTFYKVIGVRNFGPAAK